MGSKPNLLREIALHNNIHPPKIAIKLSGSQTKKGQTTKKMAVARNSQGRRHQTSVARSANRADQDPGPDPAELDDRSALAAELKRRNDRDELETNIAAWKEKVQANVSKTLFAIRQFIYSNEEEDFGSKWQGLCMKGVGVPDEHAEDFWDRKGGKVAARKALNRKRMNVTNAIKKQFSGKVTR
jgi:hypothetical protein